MDTLISKQISLSLTREIKSEFEYMICVLLLIFLIDFEHLIDFLICVSANFEHKGTLNFTISWVKVFKNGPSKICGRQPLKNLK